MAIYNYRRAEFRFHCDAQRPQSKTANGRFSTPGAVAYLPPPKRSDSSLSSFIRQKRSEHCRGSLICLDVKGFVAWGGLNMGWGVLEVQPRSDADDVRRRISKVLVSQDAKNATKPSSWTWILHLFYEEISEQWFNSDTLSEYYSTSILQSILASLGLLYIHYHLPTQ